MTKSTFGFFACQRNSLMQKSKIEISSFDIKSKLREDYPLSYEYEFKLKGKELLYSFFQEAYEQQCEGQGLKTAFDMVEIFTDPEEKKEFKKGVIKEFDEYYEDGSTRVVITVSFYSRKRSVKVLKGGIDE